MNRLKFRIWNDREKVFFPYGTSAFEDKDEWWGGSDEIFMGTLFQLQERKHYILQQWTGLTDKNGKDVFVGDLVNFTVPKIIHGPEREDYANQEVIFDSEIASFAFGKDSMTILSDRIDEKSIEVVGNIFTKGVY